MASQPKTMDAVMIDLNRTSPEKVKVVPTVKSSPNRVKVFRLNDAKEGIYEKTLQQKT